MAAIGLTPVAWQSTLGTPFSTPQNDLRTLHLPVGQRVGTSDGPQFLFLSLLEAQGGSQDDHGRTCPYSLQVHAAVLQQTPGTNLVGSRDSLNLHNTLILQMRLVEGRQALQIDVSIGRSKPRPAHRSPRDCTRAMIIVF